MKKILSLVTLSMLCISAMAQKSFQVPPYTTFKLPNGLVVQLMEQKEVPLISIAMSLPASTNYDGAQAGLSQLTASSLVSGTKNFTKDQIQNQLDFAGASLNAYSATEFTRVSARCVSKDQNMILGLLKEIVQYPTFPEAEYQKLQTRTKASLEMARQSPRAVTSNYWNKMMYGNHVYGNPASGLVSTVSAITVGDLQKFHSTYYRPNGSVLAIVGDFNSKEMKARITALFSDWKKSGSALKDPASEAIQAPTGNNVLLVNKNDARETTFFIGKKGITRNNEDRVAIEVINTVFGDRFTSWLNDELRVNSGLTYGAGSRFASNKFGGTFYITTFTATKTTFQTVDKALEVFDRLQNGIDEKTLESARNYVVGQFPPTFETSGQLAALLNDMFIFDYDASFINDFQKNVGLVTREKAKQIIQKYFSKNDLQFLMIGKASEIREGAKKYGKVTEKEIKDDSFDAAPGKKAF